MGSGASSSNKSNATTGSQSQIKDDQIYENKPPRPSSSPAAISANDTDSTASARTLKRTRRPTSLSSKVLPLVESNDGSTDNLKELTQLKETAAAAERKAAKCEKQLASMQASVSKLESEKVILVEQINTLQSQLDGLNDSAAAAATGDRKDADVLSSEQIASLQQELAEAKTRIKKISIQYKRKMRQFNVQLAESKQGNALGYFEQKLLVDQLKDENSKLLDQLHVLKEENAAGKTSTAAAENFPASDSRLALVLDLSSKVSEQEAEIARLKSQLKNHGKTDSTSAAAVTDNPFNGGFERETSWLDRCLISSRGERSSRLSNISDGSVNGDFASDHLAEWHAADIVNDADFDVGAEAAGDAYNPGQYHNDTVSKKVSFISNGGNIGSVEHGDGVSSGANNAKMENLRKISAPHDRKRNGRKQKLTDVSLFSNDELQTRDSSRSQNEKPLTITLSAKDVLRSSKETKQTSLLSSSKEQMRGSKPPSGSGSRKFSNNSRAN